MNSFILLLVCIREEFSNTSSCLRCWGPIVLVVNSDLQIGVGERERLSKFKLMTFSRALAFL